MEEEGELKVLKDFSWIFLGGSQRYIFSSLFLIFLFVLCMGRLWIMGENWGYECKGLIFEYVV